MEDLFYIATELIGLGEIRDLAVERGYPWVWSEAEDDYMLDIWFGQDLFWKWELVDDAHPENTVSFEEAEWATVHELGGVRVFMVSFRATRENFLALRDFIAALMARHGGWVTGDTEGLRPAFDLDHVGQMNLPYLFGQS